MSKHKTHVVQGNDGLYYATCTCLWGVGDDGRYLQRWQAEDVVIVHTKQVEQAKAHLRRGRSSLKAERDHAKQKIADPTTSDYDRGLWRVLLTGYEARLRENTSEPEQLW